MTDPRPRYAFADERVPSVADVMEAVRNAGDAAIARRRPQLLTSLNRLVGHTGIDPSTTPFVPPVLRAALKRYTPAASGLSKKSIQNDCSNLRFLLDHLGLGGLRQYQVPLTGPYKALLDRLGDRHLQAGLSRLLRFAQVHGVALGDVDDALLRRFRLALETEGVLKEPAQSGRMAIVAWNKSAGLFPDLGLRPLTLPGARRGWGLRWSELPATLKKEVDAYFTARSTAGDLFDPDAPEIILRPRTITTQKDWLRTLASAAIRAGLPEARLGSLAGLVHPDVVEAGFRWYLEVRKANRTEFPVMLAIQALTVARGLGTASGAELARLRSLIRRLRAYIAETRTQPVRLERLLQFEDRRNVMKMLALSAKVLAEVARQTMPDREAALLVQMALVHEIFLVTSLRRGNVAALDLDRHLHWVDTKEGRRCLLRIPAREVKNNEALHKELPDHVCDLLEDYLAHWRPLLLEAPSSWLLPGRGSAHKRPATLTSQYRAFIHEQTGLTVTPHLMRSLGDMLYTDRHPEGGEVMRRHLGHRSADTRLRHYADPRSRAAGRAFQSLILDERGEALDTPGLFARPASRKSATRKRARAGKTGRPRRRSGREERS